MTGQLDIMGFCQGSYLMENKYLKENAGSIKGHGSVLVRSPSPVHLVSTSEHSDCKIFTILRVPVSESNVGLLLLELGQQRLEHPLNLSTSVLKSKTLRVITTCCFQDM